jgi:pimeloyl-ACP methyl ester carboxylesterase
MSVGTRCLLPALGLFAVAAAVGCDGKSPRGAGDAGVSPSAGDGGVGATGAFASVACEPREMGPGLKTSCGLVRVPERYDDPAGGTISLRVLVAPALEAPAAKDPVIYLDGGAGGSSIAAVVYYGAWSPDHATKALFAKRDLIAIDLRGSGGSKPSLACGELGVAALDAANGEFSAADVRACRSHVIGTGAKLGAYGTVAAATDVLEVVRALGLREFNLVGVSYGARVALEVMRRAPAGLRAVVLDSLTPPGVDALAEEPISLARAIEASILGCEADEKCQAEAPGVRTALAEVAARLEQMPVEVSTHGGSVNLNGRTFVQAVSMALREGDKDHLLPRRLHAARSQDYGFFAAVLGAPRGQGSLGANLGVVCAEAMAFTSRDAIEARAAAVPPPLGTALTARFYAAACPIWAVPAAPASLHMEVTSATPTLLLAGAVDPLVPPAWSRMAAQTLTGARTYELPGQGHAVLHGICAATAAAKFLDNPSTPVRPDCLPISPD